MKTNDQKEMKLYITDKDVANEDEGHAVMGKVETNETNSTTKIEMLEYIQRNMKNQDNINTSDKYMLYDINEWLSSDTLLLRRIYFLIKNLK